MPPLDVLVVDDDAATREGLRELLARAGFSPEDAHDGAAALEKIERNDFRVVLLDVQLPGVGGLDVLARCVEKRTPSKIIVMTGVGPTETVLAALRGQAYDFIPKPIDPGHLVDVVKRALTTRQDTPRIEILSARPEWLELLVPCTREEVDRIQSFVQRLETDLPGEVRESVGLAFRELLLNGVEWGGHLIQSSGSGWPVSVPAGCCSIASPIRARGLGSTHCHMQPATTRPIRSHTTTCVKREVSAPEGLASR